MTCKTTGLDKQANRPSLMNLGFTNTYRKMITFNFKRQEITNLQMQNANQVSQMSILQLPTYVSGKFSRFEGHNSLKPSTITINKSSICGCQQPSFKSFCPCDSQPNAIRASVWKWKGGDAELHLACRWSKACLYRQQTLNWKPWA
jgi:hypothetical protein